MTCGLPLLLSLPAPTAEGTCLHISRPQTGQEKISFLLLPGKVFLLVACHQEYAEHSGPPAPARGNALTSVAEACVAGQGGRAEGWIQLCRAQTPLPLPLFELLVAVLAAEAPAFPSPVPHVSAAAGVTVAQPFCCRQRGLLHHVWWRGAAVRHKGGQHTQQTFVSPTEIPDSICWMVVPTPQVPSWCPYPEPQWDCLCWGVPPRSPHLSLCDPPLQLP